MYKDRSFFQAKLRKDVDIKRHIASSFNKEVVRSLNEEIQGYAKQLQKETRENEK